MTDSSKLLSLKRELAYRVRGDVIFDDVTRGIYATDASDYMITPLAVVLPVDEADVLAAVESARESGISILPRGGGTSLSGQAVGESVVIDFSKYMDRVIEVNIEQRWARVQPGVVRDNLNAVLAGYGLQYAPDPATSSRATVGGMIGNNSSGMRSIVYGKTVDHTLETKVVLSDGAVLELGDLSAGEYASRSARQNREGEILRGFKQIVEGNRDEILRTYPKVMRRVGGYNLDEFLGPDHWNLAKLMVGSEGTLATLLEARINLEVLPKYTSLCVVHFNQLLEAVRGVEPILSHGPSAVELLDRSVISMARENLTTASMCSFLMGEPEAVLIVEFFGDTQAEAVQKAETLKSELQNRGIGYAWVLLADKAGQARVWAVRKKGLGLLLGTKEDRKPMPFIEDACVPIAVLAEYVGQVLEICRKHEVRLVTYAHASVGVIHMRPVLDLTRADDIERMKAIADSAFELVKGYGGSWSSEHGDGLNRSQFLERFYGPRIYRALTEVKRLFDPAGIMNPGKIIDPQPMDQNLRYGTQYRRPEISTEFSFRDFGNFATAVEMCSGVGECRKTLTGTMCPSYMATRDEEHSTRGRANALRLAMTGRFGPEGLAGKRLYDVLDLCLSCKACKSECPSNVDMARLKSEFLHKYRQTHGSSLRDRTVASAEALARACSGWKAPLVNIVLKNGAFRLLLEKTAGLDRRRVLPLYAREPFQQWFSRRPAGRLTKKVVLFDDCYLNYNEPQVGRAAVELLESCGYEVVLARAGCCQRTRISHGFLTEARSEGEKTMRNLDEYIRQGLTVVVCEPSCASALTDDLPDLVRDEKLGERIKENVMLIDVFLQNQIDAGRLTAGFTSPLNKVAVHGHCHQKALYGSGSMLKILERVPGLSVTEIDSGCCGMAGSFGYEKEHYELSLKIGEDRLFPAIRNLGADTSLVACGFSCRHQIQHATGVQALHWVETLRGSGAE
ncbi:MAG: FAD-linked oxidase C-terminal domain-containing protein [Candidatus Glassbacteria bacterium]